jgi:hypothetical protein
MNPDQQLVSWLAVFALIIGIYLIYKQQLSAILFGSSSTASTGEVGNNGATTPDPNNPVWTSGPNKGKPVFPGGD